MKNFITLALLIGSAYGHGVITAVTGDNGVTTMGFGVLSTIPRNGTTEQPFQLDTPVLKDLASDPCGATLEGGSIDIEQSLQLALEQGDGELPSLSSNGSIAMTIHQVNADGGGPYTAMVNTDATGKTWAAATVTQQVPGAQGLLRGGPVDSQFTAQVPDGTVCTGGDSGDVCLIRINNGGTNQTDSFANGAGPFGGCVAVTNNAAASTSSSATTSASASSKSSSKSSKAKAVAAAKAKATKANANKRKVEEIESLIAKRHELDAAIQQKRQLLTVDLIDELKTATGTAIDIPIDALAGHDDQSDNGGNSTTAKGAVLTTQQAVDLKKAVQIAIDGALSVMASNPNIEGTSEGFATANHLSTEEVAQANDDAAASIEDGELTSINQGNAGVGFFQTAVVNSLLGGISDANTATKGVSLVDSGFTGTPAVTLVAATTEAVSATATDAAAATATTSSSSKKHKGKGRRHSLNKRLLLSRLQSADFE